MSSSETSDDENSALLREAVDTEFIHDGMFNPKHTSATKSSRQHLHINHSHEVQLDLKKQPSLRPNTDKDDQFTMLGVTPQFQQYVAKQLSIILEEKLRKKLTNGEAVNLSSHKRKKGGIKLFRDSTKYAKISKTEPVASSRRNLKRQVDSESDNEIKCSEVSVNSDDILNKKDVENWTSRSKAPVFSYKKSKNGTFALIE